ncbi:hypothetical protein [Aeromonas phage BUCT552]|nr:hypothetical protein [Aeromonas phage BUCT552]
MPSGKGPGLRHQSDAPADTKELERQDEPNNSDATEPQPKE